MASYCRSFKIDSIDSGPTDTILCTSETSSNVNVTIKVDTGCAIGGCCAYSKWNMKLQRYDNGWDTIGTRSGYVCSDDPSHRTFTNVLKKNKPMRVLVYFHVDKKYRESIHWVR